ncbi:hypothetical protein ACSBR2_014169 [Camellia fascicularis]
MKTPGVHASDLPAHPSEHKTAALTEPKRLPDWPSRTELTELVENNNAWVESGALIRELYYRIAEKSKTLAFPASVCPTIGVGGHFSRRGYGTLL